MSMCMCMFIWTMVAVAAAVVAAPGNVGADVAVLGDKSMQNETISARVCVHACVCVEDEKQHHTEIEDSLE